MHNNWRIIGTLNDIEYAYAVISEIGGKRLSRVKLVDFKFVRPSSLGNFFNITGLPSEIRVASIPKSN